MSKELVIQLQSERRKHQSALEHIDRLLDLYRNNPLMINGTKALVKIQNSLRIKYDKICIENSGKANCYLALKYLNKECTANEVKELLETHGIVFTDEAVTATLGHIVNTNPELVTSTKLPGQSRLFRAVTPN